MKPVTLSLHPMSALAGAGVLALVLLGTGIAAPQDAPQDAPQRAMSPNPGYMVVIRQGTPYTVPERTRLIITSLGASTEGSGFCTLVVNEVAEVVANTWPRDSAGSGTSMTPLPAKFYAPQGAVISLQHSEGVGRAWGYLVGA